MSIDSNPYTFRDHNFDHTNSLLDQDLLINNIGKVDIHSVSALAIDDIEISKGAKPIAIKIKMSNSAGIFQIDNLLKPKLNNSGLKEYVQISVEITGEEKKILNDFEL